VVDIKYIDNQELKNDKVLPADLVQRVVRALDSRPSWQPEDPVVLLQEIASYLAYDAESAFDVWAGGFVEGFDAARSHALGELKELSSDIEGYAKQVLSRPLSTDDPNYDREVGFEDGFDAAAAYVLDLIEDIVNAFPKASYGSE
jgi:hypothetical protein